MKKLLAISLALTLLFSLAVLSGCDTSDDPASGEQTNQGTNPTTTAAGVTDPGEEITEDMLKASKPCEYVPEKIAAKMEVLIGYSLQNFNGIGGAVDARLKEELPAMGLSYTVATDEGDPSIQISNIENFITMGVAAVLIQTTDITLLEEVVGKAEEAGTSCILYGDIPQYYMSAYTSTDIAALGYGAGLIVRAWIDQTYPDAGEGEIKVAAHGFYNVTPTALISDMIISAIEDDSRCQIIYTEENVSGIDAGYDFAEKAYTVDSEVRVLVGYNLLASFGCNNYVMSLPDVDIEQWCVVGTMYDVSVEDFIESTVNGEGVFIGTVAGSTDPAWGHLECIRAVLFGDEERPVVRMQEIQCFGVPGIALTGYLDEYYYGVYNG